MENSLKIQIPDGWNEVTVQQYQDIVEVKDSNILEIISILTKVDLDIIKTMDINSLGRIKSHLSWLSKLPEDEYSPVITIDGDQYGLVGKLTDLTMGEWFDIEHYLADVNENIHKIFSILYRPLLVLHKNGDRIVEKYNNESADRRAELFLEKAMIGDVYGAFVFFSLIAKESMITIKDYLTQEILMMTKGK